MFRGCHNVLIYEGLNVPKAHNPINPTLNTVGVQCGVTMPIPCVSKIRYNITINKVACLRHAELSYLSPPHTALRFVWG